MKRNSSAFLINLQPRPQGGIPPLEVFAPIAVLVQFGLERLLNPGMSRWWLLAFPAPVLNLWLGCPSGSAQQRKLDSTGIVLAVIYWLVMLAVLALFAFALAPLFSSMEASRSRHNSARSSVVFPRDPRCSGRQARAMGNFDAFEQKMTTAGMGDAAIRAFRRNYESLLRNESGMISEDSIEPAANLASFESLPSTPADAALLSQAVVIKLNGGLGTSMGLQGPKSLLAVRDGVNFLDLMVRQILDLRKTSGAPVRLLLMNSFSTSGDTLHHLQRYRADGLADAAEVELMQNQIPKIDAATMEPVSWPADPDLEWCPPGHGDLYPALVGSGWLDRLLEEGVRYAFVSNSDNLGAILDPVLLRHFADSGAPFLMEVTRRTAADRKGGHLARRKSDGRLLLREVAQCPDADLDAFQDIARHQYFNTNSLWLRLDLLKEQLAADDGVLPLPMIRNSKTVDPRDKKSTPVIQLESAMGAAIECFDGSAAIDVPRSRFAPVKTTGDLLALRSDAYEVLENGQVRLHPSRQGKPPVISLSDEYKLVDSIDALGVPSLIGCRSLKVAGPVHFEPGVIIEGDVEVTNTGAETRTIAAGAYRDQTI